MRSPPRWRSSAKVAGALIGVAAGGLLWLTSCGDNLPARVDPTTSKLLGGVNRPVAAALDKEGKNVYVVGHDDDGVAQIYTLPAAGGAATMVSTEVALAHPIGMVIDGENNMYVADIATDDGGMIYKGPAGGKLTALAAMGVLAPAGIITSPNGKDVYVTGHDRGDRQAGVFKIAEDGNLSVVAKGAPFRDPSALTFSNDGTLYVMDATAADGQGAVIKVVDGKAAPLTQSPLQVGFAAGITAVGAADLLITTNAQGAAGVLRVASTGEVTTPTLGGDQFSPDGDPATITQAAKANAWVALDTASPPQAPPGSVKGAILLLTP